MDLKMDSVIIHGKMVPTIKDNLRMAKEMDQVFFIKMEEFFLKVNG